ncbi:hypothetical protein ZWY2020_007217 [Hordeum vulgare]|nr:hypothetical protein ZWY2020_007217 [Hordeum vulgare]
MAHVDGSSSGGGSASKSNWPLSLDQPTTEELYRFRLLLRPRRRAAVPQPPPSAPPVPAEFDLPPEQVVLRVDGDPDDTPGLLVALRASQAMAAVAATAEAAREEAEIAAAIQAVQARGVDPQPAVGEDDDDVDWDGLAISSDDDGGSDGGGAGVGQDVVFVDVSD